MMIFSFKSLEVIDLPLLHQWFQEPILKKWYARNINFSLEAIHKKYLPRILGKEQISSFIVFANNHPIGFIQYYALSHFLPEGIKENNAVFHLAQSHQMVGIDFFIGEVSHRRKGFAENIFQQFSESFLEPNFLIEVVDPSVHNKLAIHFFQKCGFAMTSYSDDPNFVILIKRHTNNIQP